jgi:hypothetical protein
VRQEIQNVPVYFPAVKKKTPDPFSSMSDVDDRGAAESRERGGRKVRRHPTCRPLLESRVDDGLCLLTGAFKMGDPFSCPATPFLLRRLFNYYRSDPIRLIRHRALGEQLTPRA